METIEAFQQRIIGIEEFVPQVVAEVRRLAQEFPDRKAHCVNVRQDTEGHWHPECIVGTAFWNLGVGPTVLAAETAAVNVFANVFPELRDTVRYRYMDNVLTEFPGIKWLSDAQYSQDNGTNWADAVHTADELAQP